MSIKRPVGYRARVQALRKRLVSKLLFFTFLLAFLALIPIIFINLNNQSSNERRDIRDLFDNEDFESAFLQSKELLTERPLDYFLLTVNGFSAYQLAVAQINNYDANIYLEEAIWSLRRAILINDTAEIHYVLGKAYYHKGPSYADLAIKYLEKARDANFLAKDIPEYLGLSYASIQDYRSSIEAFSLALSGEYQNIYYQAGFDSSAADSPSDILLLSIARSYIEMGEGDSARAYLMQCINISRDSRIVSTARLLLAGIYFDIGDFERAELEYLILLEENGESAEAYFQLGEIYFAQGDNTRARAEWRRALRVDSAYRPARMRLNL